MSSLSHGKKLHQISQLKQRVQVSRQVQERSTTLLPRGRLSSLNRVERATGDQLVYTASDDKFVLTGGPPSIFDAEHGKITGVSLTLFRHDDRVLVEGDNTSPTVTQTRVAR